MKIEELSSYDKNTLATKIDNLIKLGYKMNGPITKETKVSWISGDFQNYKCEDTYYSVIMVLD